MAGVGAAAYLAQRGDRLVIAQTGGDKVGKTHAFWTFPGPWHIIDLDLGCDESLNNAAESGLVDMDRVTIYPHLVDEDITMLAKDYIVAPDMSEEERSEKEIEKLMADGFEREITEQYRRVRGLYDELRTDYITALEHAEEEHGSVCMDPASKLWTVVSTLLVFETEVRKARKWKRDRKELPDDRRDYGRANSAMDGLIMRAMACNNANALFNNKGAIEFQADKEVLDYTEYRDTPKGKKAIKHFAYRSTGYRGIGSVVQASLNLHHTADGIVADIESCRKNRDLEGTPIYDPNYENIKLVLQAGGVS